MDFVRIFELITVLVLSSYYPILTYSFFRFRLTRKQEELELLLERVKLLDHQPLAVKDRLSKEFTSRDYVLPMLFVTFITMVGMVMLLASWMIYGLSDAESADSYRSILFAGSSFWEDAVEFRVEKRNVAVVAFSIMGSFIGGTQYIYRRFSTIDLTPGNFFSVGIRMISSVFISLLIAYLTKDAGLSNGNHILAIAFLVGIFPERGMTMLLRKVSLFPKPEFEFKNKPVEVVEGISELHKLRLAEVGIDNVQNLAHFNFFLLIIKTPFPVRMLLDWVAQAKLVVEFQQEFEALQKAGIRNVLDYLDALLELESLKAQGLPISKSSRLEEIAQVTGISKLALEINYQNLKDDQSVKLLLHFRANLEHLTIG